MQVSGPNCKYFYTTQDGGLISIKRRGSLAKRSGRTVMGGLRLLDLDLRARIRLVLDLIRIVHARSDDQG